MKRLFLAIALLWASPLAAEPYRALSFRQLDITTSGITDNTPMASQTRVARVVCSATCNVAFAVSPVVAANTAPVMLPGSWPEYFRVSPGAHVHVFTLDESGIIYITEME